MDPPPLDKKDRNKYLNHDAGEGVGTLTTTAEFSAFTAFTFITGLGGSKGGGPIPLEEIGLGGRGGP